LVELIIIALAILAGTALVLWAWGRQEGPFVLGAGEAWFVALKRDADAPPLLGDIRWSSRADLTFVGPDDPYWSEFAILSGQRDDVLARVGALSPADAFVARIRLIAPPALAFGVLKALIAVGVLSKPDGPLLKDISGMGYDMAFMPSASNIGRLLAKPAKYAPAMVNFLQYKKPDGAQAYMRYGRVAMRTVYRTGGRLLFFARVREIARAASAGPCVGEWDELAAMQYSRPDAILSMEHAPDYRAVLVHRDAGLARTVVIASTPGGRA
jgi:uncharacterized protein (DUF1330 family)